jgi:hypothetical protein
MRIGPRPLAGLVSLAILVLAAAAGAAAGDATPAKTAAGAGAVSPDVAKETAFIYETRCAMCHGAGGKGDGPMGAALTPKPRDLGDPAWQKSVTDEHIEKIIVGGGPAVGKSPLMAANPDLASKPDVVKALRQMVRNFGK